MPGDEEKKSKPEDSKKADKNADKKDKAEPSQQAELTEEEQEKKEKVELLVERVGDSDADVCAFALTELREEIRSSTASMTSIPLVIKFLRAHFDALQEVFNGMTHEQNKAHLADLLSVLAVSKTAVEERETLRFKLLGNIDSLDIWGHEYVRTLSGEIGLEYQSRLEEEASTDDLMPLIENILSFNMAHNGEAEACDLLLEVEQLELLKPFVDKSNCSRVCLYLLANASYAPEPEDKVILRCAMQIYKEQGLNPQALVVAMKLNDHDAVQAIYSGTEGAERKQLALILGRHRLFSIDEEDEELLDLIGNAQLSDNFLSLGRDLDVVEAKLPEDIYKTDLLDSRYASNLAQHVDSAKQNLASSFVNGFVNAGFKEDKLLRDESRAWLFKNKDEGRISAAASLGMISQWDIAEGPDKLNPLLELNDNKYIRAGAALGTGIVCCGIQDKYYIATGMLGDLLSADEEACVRMSAILGLGMAKAGTSDDGMLEDDSIGGILQECEAPIEELAACALSLGLVYAGTGNATVSEWILTVLQLKDEELDSAHTRYLCLGLGLVYLGKQSEADVTLEILSTIAHESTKQYALMTVETCAYAGTGNVLKIQKLMHACGDHLEKDNDFQSVAVIGIALISIADDVARAMCQRTFDHMLQYGDPVVRRAVPLALALTSLSHPHILIVDTLSKLSHDQDAEVAQGAVFSLGLIGAGTNNSRIAGLLRDLSAYYSKEPDHLFVVRLAQGLLHLGKGTMTISPFHSHNLLMSHAAIGGIMTVLHSFLDLGNISRILVVHGKYHYYLHFIAVAIAPRMLLTVDEALKPLTVPVRVGQAVDTIGQAGKPKSITGFQTHSTPVLLGPQERAELATNEYLPYSEMLEGVVILRKNPDFEG